MTPREKADELYKMYNNLIIDEVIEMKIAYLLMSNKMAKQCALISVDEILRAAFFATDEIYNFYIEVKQEIEKL